MASCAMCVMAMPSRAILSWARVFLSLALTPVSAKAAMYHDLWGTGEYQISLNIRESCTLTKSYKDNWRKNRRARKRAEKSGNVIQNAWQTVTSQQWDEITKSWIITILQAPADVLSDDLIEKLHLTAE